jgi:ABC-type branched-subunit amino acid transport system substrate-binding protein
VTASGAIRGHQVQVVYEDDASNRGTSLVDAQTLIAKHVVAIAQTMKERPDV